ncbi:hypothetical protein XnspCFBP7698_16825 [Xanthomonas sp. CFBP 7698]|nr:hypothetical protein XnspCFBP7698_16825 [Xanthomonas sp. CFBP 7698]
MLAGNTFRTGPSCATVYRTVGAACAVAGDCARLRRAYSTSVELQPQAAALCRRAPLQSP